MRFIFLIILIVSYVHSSSQKLEQGCWIPEQYIDSIQARAFGDHSHLITPIESILVSGDTVSLMSFHSEYLIAKTRKADKNRIQITNFAQLINQNFPSAIAYINEKCFVYMEKQYLAVQIGEGSSGQIKKFIRSHRGLLFNNPVEVAYRYMLAGKYNLGSEKIELQANGDVVGARSWKKYKMLRQGYNSIDDNGRMYNLITFEGDDESTFAVRIEGNELVLFEFSAVDRGDYRLKVSEIPKYVLKRTKA